MFRIRGILCWLFCLWQICFVAETDAAVRQRMSRAMGSDNFVRRTTSAEDAQIEEEAKINEETAPAIEPKTEEELEQEYLLDECAREKTNFNRSCAAKLFGKLCGNLVFTEDKMPPKVNVVKGSTIELQLENKDRDFWKILNSKKNVLQKQVVAKENGTLIVKYKAKSKGATKLSLYNMAKSNDDYVVKKVKFFKVYVD